MKLKLMTFGDRVSSGDPADVFITCSYEKNDIGGGVLIGPFKSIADAKSELIELKLLQRIYNPQIITRLELMKGKS